MTEAIAELGQGRHIAVCAEEKGRLAETNA
jgi:hypothetical protein